MQYYFYISQVDIPRKVVQAIIRIYASVIAEYTIAFHSLFQNGIGQQGAVALASALKQCTKLKSLK